MTGILFFFFLPFSIFSAQCLTALKGVHAILDGILQ